MQLLTKFEKNIIFCADLNHSRSIESAGVIHIVKLNQIIIIITEH